MPKPELPSLEEHRWKRAKAATFAESRAWDAVVAAAPKNTLQTVIVKNFEPADVFNTNKSCLTAVSRYFCLNVRIYTGMGVYLTTFIAIYPWRCARGSGYSGHLWVYPSQAGFPGGLQINEILLIIVSGRPVGQSASLRIISGVAVASPGV